MLSRPLARFLGGQRREKSRVEKGRRRGGEGRRRAGIRKGREGQCVSWEKKGRKEKEGWH